MNTGRKGRDAKRADPAKVPPENPSSPAERNRAKKRHPHNI